jgi:hypothetical protein
MKDRKQPDAPDETMVTEATTPRPKGHAALGREIQAKIGQQLRAYYDSLIEPTPERFAELLRQLDKADSKEPNE